MNALSEDPVIGEKMSEIATELGFVDEEIPDVKQDPAENVLKDGESEDDEQKD